MPGERPRARAPKLDTSLLRTLALAGAVLGLLALVALGARGLPGAPGPGSEPLRLRVDLSSVTGTGLAVLVVLLAAFFVWLFWPDGTESWEDPPRRNSVIATLAGIVLLMVGLYFARSALVPPEAIEPPSVTAPDAPEAEPAPPSERGPALPIALVLAGAAIAAVALRSLRRGRSAEVDAAEPTPAPASTRVAHDPPGPWPEGARGQVIRAYDEMERAFATAGSTRSPWEAPREYLARLEQGVPPGPEPAQLTRLYEVARFSRRQVDAETADTARAMLDRLRRRLSGRAGEER